MGMGMISAGALAQDESPSPLAPRAPHFAPKAKRVVHFFLNGGPRMSTLSIRSRRSRNMPDSLCR
jgi:hypothetical protein